MPASAAPASISSMTRQHSESHKTQHKTKLHFYSQNYDSLKEKPPAHQFMSTNAQTSAIPLQTQKAAALTQVVIASHHAQRAESPGTMYLSGLLHCQYLPSSMKPEEQRLESQLIQDLTPQLRNICHMLKKKSSQPSASKLLHCFPWPA